MAFEGLTSGDGAVNKQKEKRREIGLMVFTFKKKLLKEDKVNLFIFNPVLKAINIWTTA